MTTSPNAQQLLLRRILASKQFAHADNLKRILLYLVERSTSPLSPPPKEYEIAVYAMNRPPTFDPATDPIVRVSLGNIRERLNAFFGTEGRDEPLRLEIPKGRYRAIFVDGPPASLAKPEGVANSSISKFWAPYFQTHTANILVYTEPLFFRDNQGRYFRDWSVNRLPQGAEEIREHFPGLSGKELQPAYHYLSAGEMHCMLSITRLFHERGIPVETRNSRISQWQELSAANLILLGSPRTNQFLASLQGDYPLITRGDCIVDVSRGRKPRVISGKRFSDGNLPRMTEYAVLTRRPGVRPGCTVTMIAANHGRAIEGAGHMMTLEDRTRGVLKKMKIGKDGSIPSAFQLLVRVDCIDIDDEVADAECDSYHEITGSRFRAG
ncbi:MAG: hypothetical protein ABI972_11305 [Acidobacteriota bacterium]